MGKQLIIGLYTRPSPQIPVPDSVLDSTHLGIISEKTYPQAGNCPSRLSSGPYTRIVWTLLTKARVIPWTLRTPSNKITNIFF